MDRTYQKSVASYQIIKPSKELIEVTTFNAEVLDVKIAEKDNYQNNNTILKHLLWKNLLFLY